ncbi:BEN domain-containing protein 2 [Triplophysa tibetana]|uniref:BEN domain-containing protein 2 n=1 Tax=Triplophysa tibetana TaxID=1572043 RepID=A0A5A9NBM3_9TELE|nr:BEN domain-containing protein 2 [Triplophysa tibetana]
MDMAQVRSANADDEVALVGSIVIKQKDLITLTNLCEVEGNNMDIYPVDSHAIVTWLPPICAQPMDHLPLPLLVLREILLEVVLQDGDVAIGSLALTCSCLSVESFILVSSRLCSMKTGAADGRPLSNDGTSTVRCRGVSPASDKMGMNGTSIEINVAEQKRTLGEILACCQVTYGAILKLEEKFDMLQAKVANIQTLHENPLALLSQKTCVSSGKPDSFHSRSKSLPTSTLSMPHLPHISTSFPVDSRKRPTQSPGPEVKKPLRLYIQNQPHNSVQKPLLEINRTEKQKGRVNGPTRINIESTDLTEGTTPANSCCVGKSERKVFLPYSVLHKAGKMARPSAAVGYLLRNMFTTEELSQSSTSRNPTRRLKRLDPNKISAIRGDMYCVNPADITVLIFTEWAGKRYPKFDFREKGKEWNICLSVINSMARYFRFVGKTQKQKLNSTKVVPSKVEVKPAGTAEIDVELSDSDTEQKPQEKQRRKINSMSDCDRPADMNYNRAEYNLVYIGSSHREVKVPESALTAAHMRKRPELIARYLIKFIFPEDVLVRSNVYGARTGMDPLDHNKISALREHLSEHFPWMKLEEDGCDWKVCVGAINSTIRKCRFERKMGIKRGKC